MREVCEIGNGAMTADGNQNPQDDGPWLNVLFIDGTILRGNSKDVLRWLREPTTVLLGATATIIFLIYSAYVAQMEYLPPQQWQVALQVGFFVVTFFLIVIILISLGFAMLMVQPNFIVPISLVIVIAHVINQIVSARILEAWDIYLPYAELLYYRIIAIYLLILPIEIVYSVYLLPRSGIYRDRLYISLFESIAAGPQEDSRPAATPGEPAKEASTHTIQITTETDVAARKTIRLGDREYGFDEIRMIEAEQNYVRIHTASDAILVRAQMNATINKMSDGYGVRVHRSCWVSFDTILQTKTLANRRLAVELATGEVVIAPRARRKTVLEAIERYTTVQSDP